MKSRAKPSDASLTKLQRALKGLYSFNVKDVARILKRSIRSAERYIVKLKELDVVELRYRGTDRYYYYRIRRNK
jgi:DNA-binding transcriptional ArsR family regulator